MTAWIGAALLSWRFMVSYTAQQPCPNPSETFAAELEAAVEQTVAAGGTPFFVGATAGSTVLGAFDPLPELAQVNPPFLS